MRYLDLVMLGRGLLDEGMELVGVGDE